MEKELLEAILTELKSINKKLKVIGSNFELKDKKLAKDIDSNGKVIRRYTVERNLDYLR